MDRDVQEVFYTPLTHQKEQSQQPNLMTLIDRSNVRLTVTCQIDDDAQKSD